MPKVKSIWKDLQKPKIGYIYKIVPKKNLNDIYYIGSTYDLQERIYVHMNYCKCEKRANYKLSLYQNIRNKGGWLYFDLIEIDKIKYKNRDELLKLENDYIENLKPKFNILKPIRKK